MATLSPLAKGLIAVIIVGAAGSAAWNLFLKEKWASRSETSMSAAASASAVGQTAGSGNKSKATTGSGPLGGADNPLKVSIVSFHGYAPALVANGNSLTTQANSI